MMSELTPSPTLGRGAMAIASGLLLLASAATADAQTGSGRKTMVFGVVPADPQAGAAPDEGNTAVSPSNAVQDTAVAASGATVVSPAASPQQQPAQPSFFSWLLPQDGAAASAAAPASPSSGATAPSVTAAGGAVLAVAPPAAAQSPATPASAAAPAMPSVQSGLLECRGDVATAYGFGSSRKVRCEFRPSAGMVQYYVGTMERVGLDIGISDQGSMLWGVLGTSPNLADGALAGRYVGVTSGFALGPGFSANMLASEDATRQVTLQPVSVSADSGLSLSIAGASLTLVPSATRPR